MLFINKVFSYDSEAFIGKTHRDGYSIHGGLPGYGLVFAAAGDDNGGYDVSQKTAAAQGAEGYPAQPHQGGVNVKIFPDAAANAVNHLVFVGFIELLCHGLFLLMFSTD